MFPGFKIITIGSILLLLAGCVSVVPVSQPSRTTPRPATLPAPPESIPSEEPAPTQPLPETAEKPREAPTPRALASLERSRQAQLLIDENRLDEAIRILEQAINLHPGSGESYYYLAEAWRRKGNLSQALEYNNLAAIRLQDAPEWMERIVLQKKRIERIR